MGTGSEWNWWSILPLWPFTFLNALTVHIFKRSHCTSMIYGKCVGFAAFSIEGQVHQRCEFLEFRFVSMFPLECSLTRVDA